MVFFACDDHFSKGYPKTKNYEDLFHTFSEHTLKGEICVDYMFRPTCMARLALYNPEIKIITILRNPAERAYSHWQNNVNKGCEDLAFMDAIEAERTSMEIAHEDQSNPRRTYLTRSMYSAQVSCLLQYFDPHQILVLRNEDLRDDTDVVLYQTCQFLGIPYFEVDKTPRELGDYESSMRPQDYNKVIQYLESDMHSLNEMVNWDCEEWLRPVNLNPVLTYVTA